MAWARLWRLSAPLLLKLVCGAAFVSQEPTPVQRVVQLLQDIRTQLAKDAEEEMRALVSKAQSEVDREADREADSSFQQMTTGS